MRMQTNSLNGKEIYVSAIGKSIIFFCTKENLIPDATHIS